jgi:hypothetical protein
MIVMEIYCFNKTTYPATTHQHLLSLSFFNYLSQKILRTPVLGIRMFLGLLDPGPGPWVRVKNPDPDPRIRTSD